MWSYLAVTALFFAAAPGWQTKPPAQWNEADAKQILAESPWVGAAQLQKIPSRAPFIRRDSGDWDAGVGHGVGLEGTGLFGEDRERLAIARAHEHPGPVTVPIIWASAAPVRAAERRLGVTDAPDWGPGYYAITLLDVPADKRFLNAGHLKNLAFMKRPGLKDFKAVRTEILDHGDGFATLVYLFPRTVEITRNDPTITFTAQVGEIFISNYFYPEKMVIAGQLEL